MFGLVPRRRNRGTIFGFLTAADTGESFAARETSQRLAPTTAISIGPAVRHLTAATPPFQPESALGLAVSAFDLHVRGCNAPQVKQKTNRRS